MSEVSDQDLVLGDGSRLVLDEERVPAGWTRREPEGSDAGAITVEAAIEAAGAEHEEYVRIRTRSEAAWLRIVSEWFADQARRLEGDLERGLSRG